MERHQTVTLLDIVALLLRRRRIIIAITLGVAVLGTAVVFSGKVIPPTSPLNLMPDKFVPTVKILLQESSPASGISDMLRSSGLSGLASLAGLGTGSKRTSADLARDLLKTTTLLDAVCDDLGIVERYGITGHPRTNSRKLLTEHLEVRYSETSGIMTIGYEDVDREFATKAVTRVVQELAAQFRRLTLDQVEMKRKHLESSITRQVIESDRASQQLVMFQGKYGVLDVSTQVSEVARSLSQLQSQLTAKQLELNVQQKYFPDTDARIVKLKGEIEELQKLMGAMREGSGDYSTGEITQRQLPALQIEYATLRRESEIQQQILAGLKQQLELVRLEELSAASIFQIVDKAEVLEMKTKPRRGMFSVILTFVGAVTSVFVALLVDYFSRNAHDPASAHSMAALRDALRPVRRRRAPDDGGRQAS